MQEEFNLNSADMHKSEDSAQVVSGEKSQKKIIILEHSHENDGWQIYPVNTMKLKSKVTGKNLPLF